MSGAALAPQPLAAAPAHAALRPGSPAARPGAAPVETVVETIVRTIDDAKGVDILTIDLAGKTALADFMVIASGGSDRHVGAIAERIVGALKDRGLPPPRVEGMPVCDWVLIDAGDIIVHLFRPEVRGFYNLEKLWGFGRPVEGGEAADEPGLGRPVRPRRIRSAGAEGAAKPARRKPEQG